MSLRAAMASSYFISGCGLAMAKTIGFLAIVLSIFGVRTSATDSPRKTSAPLIASSRVEIFLSVANSLLYLFRSFLFLVITPLLSTMTTFSSFIPKETYSLVQDIAAAPAPLTTSLRSSIFFPASSVAFNKPAPVMMAVPCWSSCMTGISSSFLSRSSISKHSGALISSKLMPPKVGEINLTVCTNLSTSLVLTSMSKTSTSPNILKSNPFPSITGLPDSGPISPSPRTAVPLEITATRLPLAVYL